MTKAAQSKDASLATVLVTPRERFGVAVESLKSVIEHTRQPYHLIYIDAGSPPHVAQELRALCDANGFRYERIDALLSPNTARNLGQRLVTTPYTAFLENDVIVTPGWLEALVDCAQETGAEVIAPLICQNLPLHSEVHHAGGTFAEDHRAFFEGPPEQRRLSESHLFQGEKVEEIELKRMESQSCEFHCVLVDRRTFERFGELDENMLAIKEHLDFCMTVWSGGGRVIFEPTSVVTYLFPSRARPMEKADWPFFALRWSPAWQRQSLDHFMKKWSIEDQRYFDYRMDIIHWRHEEGIAKQIAKKIPLVTRSWKVKTAVIKVITAVLHRWSDRLVKHNLSLTQKLRALDTASG